MRNQYFLPKDKCFFVWVIEFSVQFNVSHVGGFSQANWRITNKWGQLENCN